MKRKGDRTVRKDGKVLLKDKNGNTRFIVIHAPEVYNRRPEDFDKPEYQKEYERNYRIVRDEKIAAMMNEKVANVRSEK